MKTKLILSIAIFLVVSTCAYSQMTFPLTGYEGNPVLEKTGGLMFPFVYYEDETFYLFYTVGDMTTGPTYIGMATSIDGYNFTEYEAPVFEADGTGFDAYSVCFPAVIKKDETYYLFYAAASSSGFCSDGITGQATAAHIWGPYEGLEEPILEKGSPGEWDDHGVAPDQVFDTDSGFVMYYTGTIWDAYPEQEGLAFYNGNDWVKYDDPTTTNPPFAESDPVLKFGNPGSWDEWCASMVTINQIPSGWEMLYQAGKSDYSWRIGYATSVDGINWIKKEDPVYSYLDDPFATLWGFNITGSPNMVVVDNEYYIYYDYGDCFDYLGMATTTSIQAHNLEPIPEFPFNDYENNPVLGPGTTGNWDDFDVFGARFLEHDGIFYMYYTGKQAGGIYDVPWSIGYATSTDGYNFDKQTTEEPMLSGDGSGFDAWLVSCGIVMQDEFDFFGDDFYMIYGGLDAQDGTYAIGLATSNNPIGSWERHDDPILECGDPGEWDGIIIYPYCIIQNESEVMLYYSGGVDLYTNWQAGLAIYDGTSWAKYNDTHTTSHPFEQSDPVLKYGEPGEWDSEWATMPFVKKIDGGYEMFYSGRIEITKMGYATSLDGINWYKHNDINPFYSYLDDSFAQSMGYTYITNPGVIIIEDKYFMYYDYANDGRYISLATDFTVGVHSENDTSNSEESLMVSPNPFNNEITIDFYLNQSGPVEFSIMNINGQQFESFSFGHLNQGSNKRLLNINKMPSGVYFCMLKTTSGIQTTKIVKL